MPTKKGKLSLNDLLKKVNKQYKDNTMLFADSDGNLEIETISTNSFTLDYVLGKGLPRGRIIECFGAESSGKSTMAAFLVAQIQAAGGKALWVDAEYSFSKEYYKDIGVKFDKSLMISQPDCGEEGLDIVIQAVNTGEFDIIVVDSVSALVPRKELDGEIEDVSVALQARMMSKALRMLTGSISSSKTILIFINQIRSKIGVFFGKKTTTSGGKSLNFYSSIRLEVKKGKKILGANEEVIGNELFLSAIKNKVAPPFRQGKIELIYAKGVDLDADWTSVAIEKGIIKRDGTTYSYDGKKLATGKDKTVKFLKENKDILNKIVKEVNGTIKTDAKKK